MRKSFAILLLLVLLAASGIGLAHGRINSARGTVELQETVLAGDRAAAEGLGVDISVCCSSHLFWDTRLDLGENNNTVRTDFLFSQAAKRAPYSGQEYSGVSLNLPGNFDYHSTGGIDLEEQRTYDLSLGSLYELLKDVADRAPNGEEYTEQVYFRDYYELYPLTVYVDLPAYYYEYTNDEEYISQAGGDENGAINRKIAEFFKIPVDEDYQVKVTVFKSSDGRITDLNVEDANDRGLYYLYTSNVVTNRACYFLLEAGGDIDTSLIPGGRGIYCLPYDVQADTAIVNVDGLSMVFPLEEDVEPMVFESDPSGERLLLFTREEEKLYLRVIRMEDMEQLQKLYLTDYPDDAYVSGYNIFEDFIYLEGDNVVLAELTDSGEYAVRISTPAALVDEDVGVDIRMDYQGYDMAWDGERLAVVKSFRKNYADFYYFSAGSFLLWVYDETGLVYCGRYDSSLNACQPVGGSNMLGLFGDKGLTAEW